jgi:hypothetical protein
VQIIYAAPFVLLSVAAFLCCVIVPRLREYALQAFVAPLAFGICSIIGFALIALGGAAVSERFGFAFPNWTVLAVCFFAYIVFGLTGAWLALRLVHRFGRHMDFLYKLTRR